MDIRKVKKLMEMLEESSLSELEIIEGEESIRLSKATNVLNQNDVNQLPEVHNNEFRCDRPQQIKKLRKLGFR